MRDYTYTLRKRYKGMVDFRFRGWHVPTRTMVYQKYDEERALYVFQIPKSKASEILLSQMLRSKQFIPMIFTGELDINKRPLYEGDLVRRWLHDGRELSATAIQHTARFWMDNAPVVRFEIIGNIYEGIIPPEKLESPSSSV